MSGGLPVGLVQSVVSMRTRRLLPLSTIGLLAACHALIDDPDAFSFVPNALPDAGETDDTDGDPPKQGPMCCGPTCKVCPQFTNAGPPACDEEYGLCIIDCKRGYISLVMEPPVCVKQPPWERVSLGNRPALSRCLRPHVLRSNFAVET